MAWNQFREAMGLPAYTRAQFAATVTRHNAICAITPEQHKEFWDFVNGVDESAPEA